MFEYLSSLISAIQRKMNPLEHYNLEAFINSKNPTSIVDVEYWTRVYDQQQATRQ